MFLPPLPLAWLFAFSNGAKKSTSSRKLSSELLSSDNQLYEALTLLKGLNILGMGKQKPTPEKTGGGTGES